MAQIRRLTVEEVIAVRRQLAAMDLALIDSFGHVDAVNRGQLEMAVHRQSTSLGKEYKYSTVEDVAASLFFGIAMGHAFENGNKRTALVCTLVCLDQNRHLVVGVTEEELYDLARALAAHELPIPEGQARTPDAEIAYLSSWFSSRIRSKVLGDRPMEFSALRETLGELGCTFDAPKKNFIKISRGRWTVQTGYPRGNFQVDTAEIKRLRRALRLDESHGFDSAGFYDLAGRVSQFVNMYRNVLNRLADL